MGLFDRIFKSLKKNPPPDPDMDKTQNHSTEKFDDFSTSNEKEKPRSESEKRIRIDEVKKITDQNELADIAKNDRDLIVRWEALKNLTDISTLEYLAEHDTSDGIRYEAASRKISIQSIVKTSGEIFENLASESRDKLYPGRAEYMPLIVDKEAEKLAQIPGNPKLTAFYFAVDELDKEGYEALRIRDFVYIVNKGERFDDFKTMTVAGKCYLVAFTDLCQISKGPPITHHHMEPDEYLPIIKDMPFDGIVVNPFDEDNRNIIDKGSIEISPKENNVSDIWDCFCRLMVQMQGQGKSEGLLYLADIQQKAFDELRINGHNIKMTYNGKSGLISTYLPFLEAEEKRSLICMIGRSLTEYVDLEKESTEVHYADKVPNCIMIAIIAMIFKQEYTHKPPSANKNISHTFFVITDGDDERYNEFTELINKLPSIFNQIEVNFVCEKGNIPIGDLFQASKETQIDLKADNLEFLFSVKGIMVITTARIIFKGKILKGYVKAKDILTLTDNTGKVLVEGCPVLPLNEAEHREINNNDDGSVGMVVGVHLAKGQYDNGLILVKRREEK